jgi:hypothetical protein
MKKIFIIGLLLTSLSPKCSDGERKAYLDCSNCSDIEYVLESISKKFNIKHEKILLYEKFQIYEGTEYYIFITPDKYKIEVYEEIDFLKIYYLDKRPKNNLRLGGENNFLIKISKKDCEILDYNKFQ